MEFNDYLIFSDEGINSYESADAIWDAPALTLDQKIDFSIQLMLQSPGYWIFSRVKMEYWGFSPAQKDAYWRALISIIQNGKEATVKEIEYSLYVDFFEDQETVEHCWQILFASNDSQVDRVLFKASGPVPFGLKRNLYQKYLHDKSWHPFIFESVYMSFFGPYGDLPVPEGRILLSSIKVEHNGPYDHLNSHLQKYHSREDYIRDVNASLRK